MANVREGFLQMLGRIILRRSGAAPHAPPSGASHVPPGSGAPHAPPGSGPAPHGGPSVSAASSASHSAPHTPVPPPSLTAADIARISREGYEAGARSMRPGLLSRMGRGIVNTVVGTGVVTGGVYLASRTDIPVLGPGARAITGLVHDTVVTPPPRLVSGDERQAQDVATLIDRDKQARETPGVTPPAPPEHRPLAGFSFARSKTLADLGRDFSASPTFVDAIGRVMHTGMDLALPITSGSPRVDIAAVVGANNRGALLLNLARLGVTGNDVEILMTGERDRVLNHQSLGHGIFRIDDNGEADTLVVRRRGTTPGTPGEELFRLRLNEDRARFYQGAQQGLRRQTLAPTPGATAGPAPG
jgi:hypothetical protein